MEFTPHGVCSKNIHLEVDEAGRIHNVEFTGGCNGNFWIPQAGTCFITVTYRASGVSLKEWIFTKQFHVSKVSNADTKQHPARISFHLL